MPMKHLITFKMRYVPIRGRLADSSTFLFSKCEPATKSALNDIINQEYYYEGDFSQTNSDFESKEQSSCGG